MSKSRIKNEWQMMVALVVTYLLWAMATIWLAQGSLVLAIMLAGVLAGFHSSLSHEALHGHPTDSAWLNGALVFPALMLFIPYLRFRDTHLAHHIDARLTDPYDDPETNFQDPKVWNRQSGIMRVIYRFNNTLFGRMLIGPFIAQHAFMRSDLLGILGGDMRILMGWLLHLPAVGLVIWWAVSVGQMPGWTYLVQAYLGISLLKIRTYLEHRAHPDPSGRTVLINDRGPLALLFLNNNFHTIHHTYPKVAWHLMPKLYDRDHAKFEALNRGYVYRSYGEVFRRYLFKAKDPVPHPLWPN